MLSVKSRKENWSVIFFVLKILNFIKFSYLSISSIITSNITSYFCPNILRNFSLTIRKA